MLKFSQLLTQNDVFVSREELLKLSRKYGAYQLLDQVQADHSTMTEALWDKNNLIDYETLSKDMGLHGSFLELIQSNQLK